MLAWIEIRLVLDLSAIDRIGQQSMDAAFVELATAFREALLRMPELVFPATLVELFDDRHQVLEF